MKTIIDLNDFGWHGPSFPSSPQESPGWALARVMEEHKNGYFVVSSSGELRAETAGRLFHEASSRMNLPVVGDWVWIHPSWPGELALIHGILPRTNCLSRLGVGRDKSAGEEEPLAANVDVMLIVTSLNKEFNASRLERYGSLAGKNGVQAAVLLNKADLCEDVAPFLAEAQKALPGAAVLTISARTGSGMEQLSTVLKPRMTAVLLGSSGVGKSTLINKLMNRSVQATLEISAEGDLGRHATTSRSLMRLPSGVLLIDSPGLREVASIESADGLEKTFSDIEELSARCRFHDCTHQHEPGCAVLEARRTGELSERRYGNYQKLVREQAFLKSKAKAIDQKRREHRKNISRLIKEHYKYKDK